MIVEFVISPAQSCIIILQNIYQLYSARGKRKILENRKNYKGHRVIAVGVMMIIIMMIPMAFIS